MSSRNAYPPRNQVTDGGVSNANSRRRSSSSSIFVGSSYLMKGKYISMLYLLINLLGLLQYRGVMNRTLQEIMIHNESSYERERESAGIPSQLLPRHTSSSSTNISETIPHSQNRELEQQQQQQQQHNDISRIASTSTNTNSTTSGKFAYAFLLGGAMSPRASSDYRGGLYSVVVAAHNLRRSGSKADMVLMIQMSSLTNFTGLPLLEETLLYKMNIRIVYLPEFSDPKLESFYALMMEKFRILLLDEYDRVMYLDADVMPKCNLDYIMELSHRGDLLKENVVLASKGEPAAGGFFVLKPNASDYTKIVEIITEMERKSLDLPYPHWDPVEVSTRAKTLYGWYILFQPPSIFLTRFKKLPSCNKYIYYLLECICIKGWGHVIAAEDRWRSTRFNGTNWTWHGATADQVSERIKRNKNFLT
jgi:hypothetical protein